MQGKLLINGALVAGDGEALAVIDPAAGCDALDAYTSIRHAMIAH